MKEIDPNAPAEAGSGIFGLPFAEEESRLVLLPVPWEATTSYGGGTVNGPAAILRASHQQDLFDLELDCPYRPGIFWREESARVRELNKEARALAEGVIACGGNLAGDKKLAADLARVNQLSVELNTWVRGAATELMQSGKICGLVGGDHSTPLGALQAAGETYGQFGVLHVDAHFDLRRAYEGFEFSHASIFYNALERISPLQRLVSVGIRDCCQAEVDYVAQSNGRARVFYEAELSRALLDGEKWSALCRKIVAELPAQVWISFDIDGLDPALCPLTGTPVPGGLSFQQAVMLIAEVARSGRRIIGFDLCETGAPENFPENTNEWDANVGMRLLYKLCGWTFASQKLVGLR